MSSPAQSSALPSRTATSRAVPRRLVGGALIALVLVTAAPTAMPASARDWSPAIAAMRRTQLAYEGAMRSADAQVRALKHAARRAKRARGRAHDTLVRARERRSDRRADLADARARLARTRSRVDVLIAARPELIDLLAGAIGSATDPFPHPRNELAAMATAPAAGSPGSAMLSVALASEAGASEPGVTTAAADRDLVALAQEARTFSAALLVARGTVATLEREVRQDARAQRKAAQRMRRAQHRYRARVRAVASIGRAQRGAVARREGAEAVLGNAILGMSRLAQYRVAKKTDARPGLAAGFAWPAAGRLTQRYGCTGSAWEPRLGSCRHFHDGIDIAGYQGTPIRAAAIGVVSYIGWNPWDEGRRAFMVVVAHPGGFETLYGHTLPTRAVRVGQLVRKGQVIGYMGSTGWSTGVHLHLELRRGRRTLNPLAYL